MSPADRRGTCARCGAPESPEQPDVRVYMCGDCFQTWLNQRKPVRQLYGELRARVSPIYGGQA